jgi:rare lipoprotein A (peptidoglycan hydrolase)
MTHTSRARGLAVAISLALACSAATAPSRADELSRLERADGDLPEVQRLVQLHDRLDALLERYHRAEAAAGHARLSTVEAIRAATLASADVADAQRTLDERIRAAYQLGPGASLEAVLGATSLDELATLAEYASRAVAIDDADLRETVLAQAVASAERARAEAAQAGLEPRLEHLRSMLDEMRSTIDEATTLAVQAHLDAEAQREFAEQQRQIDDAVARSGSWDLGVIDYQQDQTSLLALLGPTGGRTCDTPPGLVATGRTFSGYATYYGWEFAGNPTATGAPFDPTLFTAANRWLPFGTFLRVRVGDRCAIVLVNDRGPYGHLERVLDLSMAAGQYLGVGVTWMDAEILLPASSVG